MKVANNKNCVPEWKSQEISDESIKTPAAINNVLNPLLEYGNKIKLKFNGSYLKQDKITLNHRKIVNIYIVYENIYIFCLWKRQHKQLPYTYKLFIWSS